MNPGAHVEWEFESEIERELCHRGWVRAGGHYRPELGLDTAELETFIGRSQIKRWDKLIDLYGGQEETQRQFAKRLAAEIDSRGVLDVLRRGVKDRGVQIDLAYFRPGHTLAADALGDYRANVLTVARQVHFSTRNAKQSVDLVLFVNGLPVATIELKNPNSGQNVDDAIAQYRARDPKELLFAKRSVSISPSIRIGRSLPLAWPVTILSSCRSTSVRTARG